VPKDPTKREDTIAKRNKIQAVLRPGLELVPDGQKAKFLHWHLSPVSFTWKDSFSRRAKVKNPQWIVSEYKVKNTKQTPPPYGKQAQWDSHDWREVKADGTLGAILMAGSANHSPPADSKREKRKLEISEQTLKEGDHNAKRHAAWHLEAAKENEQMREKYKELQDSFNKKDAEYEREKAEKERLHNLEQDRKSYIEELEKKHAYYKRMRSETEKTIGKLKEEKRDELDRLRKEREGLEKEMKKEKRTLRRIWDWAMKTQDELEETLEVNKMLQQQCEAIQWALDESLAKGESDREAKEGAYLPLGICWDDFQKSARHDKQGKNRKGLSNNITQLTGFKSVALLEKFFKVARYLGCQHSSLRRSAKNATDGTPDPDADCFSFSTYHPEGVGTSLEDRILVGLFILRTGVTNAVASAIFNVAETSVSEYFEFTVVVFALLSELLCPIPSKELLDLTCPKAVKAKYKRTVSYYLDATEIETETPDDKEVQKVTFSSYKHRNTAKFLACLAAFGALAWISVAYPGSISDKDITEVSGFLNICVHPYQMTIADKGFEGVKNWVLALKGFFNMPPKKRIGIDQLSEEDNRVTTGIANCRIHVERFFAALKHFRFLDLFRTKQYDLATPAMKAAIFVVHFGNPPFRAAKKKT